MPDFKPKVAVQLAPPKTDPISLDELAKADGKNISNTTNFSTSMKEANLGVTGTRLSLVIEVLLTDFAGKEGAKCYVAIKVRSLCFQDAITRQSY